MNLLAFPILIGEKTLLQKIRGSGYYFQLFLEGSGMLHHMEFQTLMISMMCLKEVWFINEIP